ncbi:MAG TPA: peptidyl-prolyl cis-trans isomerase [Patescibacteria group bacterium]|nr:peptidyl-prolyl cis-trans isomerase [Patescibacteria group bacterium]
MKYRIAVSILSLMTAYVLCGCDKLFPPHTQKTTSLICNTKTSAAKEETAVARVNDTVVTVGALDQEVQLFNSLVPENRPERRIVTPEQKIDFLKRELLRRILLYQEALKKGLDKTVPMQRTLERAKQEILAVALVKQETAQVEVSSAEIEDYYNKFKAELKEPEERRVREIVVPTEVEAKDILIELLKGADFATLAKERSRSSSAAKGGDLGFLTQGKTFSQFDAVAFAESLEVGQYSNIFKGPDGYYIISLEAKRGGQQRSLSELWEDIKRTLSFVKQQQHLEELIAKLSREAKIEICEGAIQ